MAKKEFKIGEVFQFGLVKLKVVPEDKCEECAIYGIYCRDLRDFIGSCDANKRSDNKDIHFVEVEE